MRTQPFLKAVDSNTRLRGCSLVSAAPLLKIEALIVLVATPFLLVPTVLSSVSLTCVVLLVAIWLMQVVLKQQRFVPASPLSICWYLFGVMVFVGIVVSAEMAVTLPEAAGVLLGFAWWRLLTLITHTKTDIVISSLLFFAMALTVTFAGLLSMEWPDKIAWLAPLTSVLKDGLFRLPDQTSGAPINANLVAAAVLLYLPLLLSLTTDNSTGKRWQFRIGILLTLALLFIELLTQSRAGWVATFVSLMFLAALKGVGRLQKWQKKNKALVVAVLVIVSLFFWTRFDLTAIQTAWKEPMIKTGVGSLHTLSFRQEMWRWGAVAVIDYPFTGVGLGTFRTVVQRQYPIAVPITYDVGHAHNVYLQLALDIGVPGLIAYLAMMLICCWMCMQLAGRDVQQRAFGHGILACLFAYHVWGLLDTLPLGSKPGVIFWMLLGLLTGIYRISPQSDTVLFEDPNR